MIRDEDFPTYSTDPELSPPVAGVTDAVQDEQELRILLRFLIGSAVEGNDEFWRRARIWQAEMEKSRLTGAYPTPGVETEAARLRYALLGIFFQVLEGGSDRLKSLQQSTGRMYQRLNRLVDPLISSRLFRPLRNGVDHMVSRGETILESWIETGRREEQLSRSLVREQAFDDLVNEVLDYLAAKPEIRDLVQDQGVGMAEEVVGEFRSRSSDIDSLLARVADAILRREPKQNQGEQP